MKRIHSHSAFYFGKAQHKRFDLPCTITQGMPGKKAGCSATISKRRGVSCLCTLKYSFSEINGISKKDPDWSDVVVGSI